MEQGGDKDIEIAEKETRKYYSKAKSSLAELKKDIEIAEKENPVAYAKSKPIHKEELKKGRVDQSEGKDIEIAEKANPVAYAKSKPIHEKQNPVAYAKSRPIHEKQNPVAYAKSRPIHEKLNKGGVNQSEGNPGDDPVVEDGEGSKKPEENTNRAKEENHVKVIPKTPSHNENLVSQF